jgi:hypothetical protein
VSLQPPAPTAAPDNGMHPTPRSLFLMDVV